MVMYDNSKVRRQDRLLPEPSAFKLLETGEYGVLSLVGKDGEAYGVPVNYVWDGDASIYVHCAPEGRKLRCISVCPSVSFCVVGHVRVVPDKFTAEYESIVLECHATVGLPPEERMRALELIIGKYSPEYKAIGLKYAEKSFFRTEIIRLDIISMSGKRKQLAGHAL